MKRKQEEEIARLTPQAARALQIIRSKKIFSPSEFARSMWPDAAGWNRICRVGYGVTHGACMPRAGGSFLARLKRRDLIIAWRNEQVLLTAKGERSLKAFEAAQNKQAAPQEEHVCDPARPEDCKAAPFEQLLADCQ